MTEPRPPSRVARAASARAAGQSPAGSLRGQRQPGGSRGAPARDVREEVATGGIAVPGRGRRHGWQVWPLGRLQGQRLLRCGVPRRDGEAEDVTQRAGIPLGRGPRSGQDAGDEHRLGRDDPAHGGQPPLVLRARLALEDEAVKVLAGEAHLDPDAGLGRLGQRLRHGVLEGAVEVGQPGVDLDRGHRVDLCGRLDRGHPAGPSRQPRADQLELLRLLLRLRLTHAGNLSGGPDGRPDGQSLAAFCSCSTRLVRSHVNALVTPSAWVRPKWP